MSLQIKGWRRIIEWTILGLLLGFFVIFLLRTSIWEGIYYSQKEGSERSVVVETETTSEPEELVEVAPTEQEVSEYTVPSDFPRYLSIKSLGINNARILPMGVKSNGELATPSNIFDVGWYDASGKPGQGGTLVIDGHNGGPHVYGVFKELPSLAIGALVTVERGDGEIFRYEVVENVEIPLDKSDDYMTSAVKSPKVGTESITLISCSGEWSSTRQTYLSRQFVRAILIKN